MMEQGRGCRCCEDKDKMDITAIDHEANEVRDNLFYKAGKIYQVWRCNVCGAYWSEYLVWCDEHECSWGWFCFGRDVKDINERISKHKKMYQETVKLPRRKGERKLGSGFRGMIGFTLLALVVAIPMIFVTLFYTPPSQRVAVNASLAFDDIRVTKNNTTIMDFRGGYLTNHTVVLFLGETNVVQYGNPKKLFVIRDGSSAEVTVLDP